jgi:hypothetical protein
MRATSALMVLAACAIATARAQTTPDTSVIVRGFLQHDPNGTWTIVVPESFEAGGVRAFVLPLQGKASRWSQFLDRYVEASGRVPLVPTGAARDSLAIVVEQMKEVEPPGTAHKRLDRDLTLHAEITLAVIPNRIAWNDRNGRPTGVNPVLLYSVQNQRQAPIAFRLPTNDLLCVTVLTDEGVTRWEHTTQARPPDPRRFVVTRGGAYRDAVQLPPDAAAKPGRYVARVGVCQVDGYDITAEFQVY